MAADVAAGCMIGGLTVLCLVKESYEVKQGDWILVHAAAGGTGLLLGQILKKLGAHAIGTVSTKAKGKLAKEAGFEHIIESYDPDIVLSKVKELTNGEGVICIYDGVGGNLQRCLINRLEKARGNFLWIVLLEGEIWFLLEMHQELFLHFHRLCYRLNV